ncbi:MAG: hypothetical protein N3B12_08800 [Armatimonadetes bacterium]|nr:hypothetical protein [Armatimonadota bacterium]
MKTRPVVSRRSLLIGAALIPLNCYWMAVMEIQWNSVDATCVSLFFHVVFLVFALALVNRILLAKLPRFAMSPAEILVIYIMLSIASAIAGRDSLENLLPLLGHAFWFADSTNRLAEFHRFVPRWLAPQDPYVLKAYYLGNASIYDWALLKTWLPIVGAWSAFILAMLIVMLSINVIVRRHWMDLEKLTFPTVHLPMEMARNQTLFRSRMLWLGFALPFVIETMNGLNHLFPSIPRLNLKLRDISPMFVSPPWNGMGWTPISFYPFAIGMAFFLPLDLSFSCWFFYVLKKLEAVAGTALGYKNPGGWAGATWPYLKEQGTGAWIGLCAFMVWAGRKHLAQIVRAAIRGNSKQESTILNTKEAQETSDPKYASSDGELLSYRAACLGVILGLLAMFVFCVRAGMSLWLPPLYLGLFFLISIGITRIRAELGPPAHELHWVNPENVMVAIFGTTNLGVQNLTALTYMFWFNRGYRSHPMPHQLEGMKIGKETGMEPKRLLAAMLIACVLGVFAAFWALLVVFNKNGQATANIQSYSTGIGVEAFNRLSDWTANPRPTDSIALSWMGLGLSFTIFLMTMKSRFIWWPFHPAGYALANSYALEYWWMTLLIGWAVKTLIVRYGGITGYRRALPFFMGLILGDYVAASMWSIVGWTLGMSVYRVFIF